jgi:uridylate kinase
MKRDFKRILLKLSGEYLGGSVGQGFDFDVLFNLARQIGDIRASGIQVVIVLGGGNFFRGTRQLPVRIDRVAGDNIGMLATVMNAVCLREVLLAMNIDAGVMTGLEVPSVAPTFEKTRALRWLNQNKVLILGGGTGNPFFSTDTAAVLRALELEADIIIKGTKVDGVFDRDPEKNPDAQKYKALTFTEILEKDLKIMDGAAIALCRDNQLPLCVLSIAKIGGLQAYLLGETVGTMISH